jgi:hypothetical protein
MSKITKEQMELLRKEIVAQAERRVFGGFNEWVKMWNERRNKSENPILDFINLGTEGWAGYTYRGYINIESMYEVCGFARTIPLDEFYLMFDRLWVTTAVRIIMKEICSSNDELAY